MVEHLYPHMVQECYVARLRQVSTVRGRKRSKVRTKKDVLELKHEMRRRLAQSFGVLPERTPLNVHVTGCLKRDAMGNQMALIGEFAAAAEGWQDIGFRFSKYGCSGCGAYAGVVTTRTKHQSLLAGEEVCCPPNS